MILFAHLGAISWNPSVSVYILWNKSYYSTCGVLLSIKVYVKLVNKDELYPEVDKFAHNDIDEEGIAQSLLPYIKSLNEIYSVI